MNATSSSFRSGSSIAKPISFASICDAPVARTVFSTVWASSARSASSTGLPWQAFRTPFTILLRLNGSITPLRFTTVSDAVSEVLKRMPHSGHWRLLRIDDPSSEVLESVTRESGFLQNGQCILGPFRSRLHNKITLHVGFFCYVVPISCGLGGFIANLPFIRRVGVSRP